MNAAELADMADFVSAFAWRPIDYWTLTINERNAIVDTYRKKYRG